MSRLEQVAHYRIERELGRGAMGVVYLARDSRLQRPVAIKALPVELGQDQVRRDRFEREARTLAAINHPNIAAIYGLEEDDGHLYLILEYVEGPTLRERLRGSGGVSSSLPLDTALEICRQIAAGLDAAHQQGIIHRDLKPDNVKIRPDGVAKVLDFGIARGGPFDPAAAKRGTGIINHDTPTVVGAPAETSSTIRGTILGTPGYMSPEQARGEPVSRATDIWSLGCVLFECLTGKIAFPGDTLADALAATLTSEPDWSLLPPNTPDRILVLIRKCLEKDHSRRGSDLSEARQEIERACFELSNPGTVMLSAAAAAALASQQNQQSAQAPTQEAGNLHQESTSFVGRDRELADLQKKLGTVRLVTLTGPPGCGKSRLALRAAATLRSGFSRSGGLGAWWVEVPPVQERAQVGRMLAAALGVSVRPGEGVVQAVAAKIGNKPALLVLDGCHAGSAASAALASELLAACPGVLILATARTALGVEGESAMPLAPLSAAPPEQAGTEAGRGRFEAGKLFLDRAGAARPDFRPNAEIAQAIARWCHQLRGVPLAVELLAGMLTVLDAPTLAEQFEQRGRMLGLENAAQPVERCTRFMVEWVYDSLPSVEKGLLHRLAVFPAPASVRALTAAAGAPDSMPDPQSETPVSGGVTQQELKVMALLNRLAARGLARARTAPADAPAFARFRLHEAVREYARELMGPAGLAASVKRYIPYFQAVIEQAVPRLSEPSRPAWVAFIEAEMPNIQAAIEFAAQTGDEASSRRIAELFEQFRAARGL